MPKMVSLLAIFLMGYLLTAIALLQDGAIIAVHSLKEQAGVLAFLIIMVDKLFSFLLKFKKDKVEQHLSVISAESIKQTIVLTSVETATKQNASTLSEVKQNLQRGLNNQKDIYSKYLVKPKKKKV